MSDITVYFLRFFIGLFWILAVLITAAFVAPFQFFLMITMRFSQPQNVRY